MAHTDLGRRILDRLVEDLKDVAQVDAAPKQDGRNMIMVIGPNKRYLEDLAKQEARAAREAAEARGLDTVDGLDMLIGQAALAFELFFGSAPPEGRDEELRALLVAG